MTTGVVEWSGDFCDKIGHDTIFTQLYMTKFDFSLMYVCTDSKGSRVRFTVEAIKKSYIT